MPVLWIKLNPSDLRSFLVFVLGGVRYESSESNDIADAFAFATAKLNPVAVAPFFEAIYIAIFEHLLASGSNNDGLLGTLSTYFGKVETNGRGILHLHCIVWLCGAFCLSEIGNRLCSGLEYAARLVNFINNIIRYSLNSAVQPKTLSWEAPSALLDKTDDDFG